MRKRKGQSSTYSHMYSLCNKHMNQYILAQLADGEHVDGIITGVDGDYLYLAIPTSAEQQNTFEPNSPAYPPYSSSPSSFRQYENANINGRYEHSSNQSYQPPQRFQRLILPLSVLVTVNALPWY